MDPIPVSAPEPSEDPQRVTLGELIVQNGRLRGTRRALASPLTLIGRSPVCEFYLNMDGVKPLHCAIVSGCAGLLLRDLGGDAGTLVNGEAIQETPLQDGDLITVGPFLFSVHLPEDDEPANATHRAERDALRIQAAAVAAQQAELTEQEAQLQQRRKALKRQKEQLAAHLDERRQHLLQLREQARQDRSALKAETEAARWQNEEIRAALNKERDAVQRELQQASKERRRSIELRKRLKKRWRTHWQSHEAALQRREQESNAERAHFQREAEKLQQERVRLMQAQLRFNGEVELERRRLLEEWQQLGLAQQQWETCLNQEQAERSRRQREWDRRTRELAVTEQRLAEQRRTAEQIHLQLRKEAEGLETRICNQRLKLLEHNKHSSAGTSQRLAEGPPVVVARPRALDVPRVLSRLADDLADQRRHLLEQWQCLVELHELWDPERSAIVVQFESAARELVLIEQRLSEREQALAAGDKDLCSRQQSLFDVRCSLEAWQARLTASETFLDNERVMLLADVRSLEEMAESQARRLEEIRQRRARRRSQEIEELRVARAQHEQMRRDYALLWQECQDRRVELIREHRDLAAKSLALEQFRQELLGRTIDTPGADKRIERLRRRNLARLQTDERDLERERAALMGETKRLDLRHARLIEREEKLVVQHEDLMKQIADWEDRQAAEDALEQNRQQELRHWQLLHERHERELLELREEVERIARLLLGENEITSAPLAA